MILVDFSSQVHRCLYTQIKHTQPKKDERGKFLTQDFQNYWKCLVLEELFNMGTEYRNYLGSEGLVLCLDYFNKKYWRKNVYPQYKEQRSSAREESEVDFQEFFEVSNDLIRVLKENTPWKVFETEGQEADDLIMVLSRQFQDKEPILIHSPDKDFIQCQRYSPMIKQWSPLTMKWITPDTKDGTMQEWLFEHIVLGDVSDNVPKITEESEFSDEFNQYMLRKSQEYLVLDWQKLPKFEQDEFLEDFYQETPDQSVYKKIRFGSQTLKKKIKEFGSLEKFLESNPVLKRNFYRNYELVMEEGIPTYLREQILKDFANASRVFNSQVFEEYLKESELGALIPMLPQEFRTEITLDFFEW